MKRKAIILIVISLLVIGALSAGIFFIINYEEEKPIDDALVITDFKEKDIDKIKVKTAENELSFRFYEIEKSGRSKRLLRLEGCEEIPSTESLYENILKNTLSLVAVKNFGQVENLSDYGLDDPAVSFTLRTKKGEEFTVKFGGLAPDNSGVYASKENSNTVYLVKKSIADSLKQNKDNFFSKNLFSYGSSEVLQVKKIILSGECREEITVEPYADETSAHLFEITAPITAFADDEKIAEFLYFLTLSVTAQDIEKINATPSDFEKYGLKEPYSKLRFEFEDSVEEISFSKEKEGKLFARINNVPVIYALRAENFSAFDYDLKYVESSKLFSCNINYLKDFKINSNGKSFEIEVNAKNKKASIGNKEVDYNDFANYYASFLSVNKTADYNKEKKGKKIIGIDISFTNDREPQSIEYYEFEGACYCFIDGIPRGAVDLSSFKERTEIFTSEL